MRNTKCTLQNLFLPYQGSANIICGINTTEKKNLTLSGTIIENLKKLFIFKYQIKKTTMKKYIFYLLPMLFISFAAVSQNGTVQNASTPKDAQVDVTMTDFKKNVLNNEIVVFKSKLNSKEFQGLTNDAGKFSVRLPTGDTYEIFILGFKDSASYNFLEIPALKGNAYYKDAFVVDIEHLPAKSFILEDCNFESGKAILQPDAFTVIDELVAYLNRKDDERIELGGHTDNVGKAPKNLKLSLDRANTVRAYLLTKGIDPARVTAKGYGMSKPIASNKTAAGKAQNRRTEVKILE